MLYRRATLSRRGGESYEDWLIVGANVRICTQPTNFLCTKVLFLWIFGMIVNDWRPQGGFCVLRFEGATHEGHVSDVTVECEENMTCTDFFGGSE